MTDPKGELFSLHSKFLKERGYDVLLLDLRDTYSSSRWNPLETIWDMYQNYLKAGSGIKAHRDDMQNYPDLKQIDGLPTNVGDVWCEWNGKAYADMEQYNTIYRLMYYMVVGICWILQLAYELLEVFSGLIKITYNEKPKYLIEVFFGNSAITNAYWGMALIGILCCFAFTIYAVSKKMFDLGNSEKGGMGVIIGNMLKSMLIILSLSSIMIITISATNTMFKAVNDLFTVVQQDPGETKITFNDEQYATMARVLNTIGNYSLSPAYSSRYNINSCYNDIRNDMHLLFKQQVFNYTYDSFKVTVDGEYEKDGTPVTAIKQFASYFCHQSCKKCVKAIQTI